MSGFKVNDEYRTNELSLRPGGYTVIVEYHTGQILQYDKIKYPLAYIHKTMKNPEVKNAWVED